MNILFLGCGNAFYSELMEMSGTLIHTQYGDILVDAGPGCLKNLLRFKVNPERIKFIFLTHLHGDHIAGLPFLLLYLKSYNYTANFVKPIVIGPRGSKRRLRKLCEANYKGANLTGLLDFMELGTNSRGKSFELLNIGKFFQLPMLHKKNESMGYRLTINDIRIAVTGDTGWNNNILELAHDCHLLITECSNVNKEIATHLSVEDFERHIDDIKASMIIPVHRGPGVFDVLREKKLPKIRLVKDGTGIAFNELISKNQEI